MKVGLDLATCLLDIHEGRVDKKHVLVIISEDIIDPRNDNTWGSWWYENAIGGFKKPIFAGHQNCNDQIRRLARELYDDGKIHCHRDYGLGTQAINLRYVWLDTIVPIPDIDDLPFVKAAWEDYRIAAGLCS